MANRPQGYGFSAEVANKINSKYSSDDEAQVVEWICARTGLSSPGNGREVVQQWLMDGLVLHSLFESFGLTQFNYRVKTPSGPAAMAKGQRNDNIGKFLEAIKSMGVKPNDMFQTVELVEGTNMNQVMICMFAVSKAARQKDVSGALIGVKQSDENKRNFDEATQKAGRNVIGLQMGTNQVASQKGMTGYGQGRQIIHNTK